jgi:hypothetical protein
VFWVTPLSEYIDEIILAFMSIYTPGKPPATFYDNYAQFIAERMHEQFTRMHNERVFKYSSVLYHMFLYYQSDNFPFTLQKLDTPKASPGLSFFGPHFSTSIQSPYTYSDFIDSFVHPVMTMLTGSPPPRISPEIKESSNCPSKKSGRLVPLPKPHRNKNIWLPACTI